MTKLKNTVVSLLILVLGLLNALEAQVVLKGKVLDQSTGEALIGADPREIHKHVALMDRMIVGNASVKCAFDMALYDLVAKMAKDIGATIPDLIAQPALRTAIQPKKYITENLTRYIIKIKHTFEQL